jgi:son of sevenless-like protein
MTAWVASEIVSAPILKQRVAVITFFIRVCEACKELNNFNTLMEILSGLDMTAIVRLKNTWESIPKRDMQSLEELREIVSRNDNYSRYRQEVDAINTPTPYLPYIGLILQDLVALEELPTIDRDGLVNFRKFKRVSKILQRVHDLKILNFKLEPIVPLQKYLKKGVQILGDMDLLRFSRVCEPSQQAMLF